VETNNVKATGAVKIGPDLVVSALTTPASAVAGGTFSLSDTTANTGGGRAGPSTTRFYLSTNSSLDAADVLLGARDVPELAPGASHAGSAVLTLPAGTPGGSYYVIAQADGGTAVAETSESNNTRVNVSLKVGADLVVSALSVPSIAALGSTINVTESTRNQGAGAVGPSATGFYLSANSVLDATDVFLGSRPVDALAAGATSTAATPLPIPAGTLPGSYYVVAKADGAGAVPEADESNNTRLASIAIGPDLTVTAVTAPSSASVGGGVTASDTTKNQGADALPASNTWFYLSTNSVWDASDVLVGGRPVAALAPGASETGSATVTIPPQTTPGTYFLIAVADGDRAIAEALENNNTRARSISITMPPAP
jgi:subtilase family serine protease